MVPAHIDFGPLIPAAGHEQMTSSHVCASRVASVACSSAAIEATSGDASLPNRLWTTLACACTHACFRALAIARVARAIARCAR
eukprot:6509814-Lingulodinium_polyedra.AAC.1